MVPAVQLTVTISPLVRYAPYQTIVLRYGSLQANPGAFAADAAHKPIPIF